MIIITSPNMDFDLMNYQTIFSSVCGQGLITSRLLHPAVTGLTDRYECPAGCKIYSCGSMLLVQAIPCISFTGAKNHP